MSPASDSFSTWGSPEVKGKQTLPDKGMMFSLFVGGVGILGPVFQASYPQFPLSLFCLWGLPSGPLLELWNRRLKLSSGWKETERARSRS